MYKKNNVFAFVIFLMLQSLNLKTSDDGLLNPIELSPLLGNSQPCSTDSTRFAAEELTDSYNNGRWSPHCCMHNDNPHSMNVIDVINLCSSREKKKKILAVDLAIDLVLQVKQNKDKYLLEFRENAIKNIIHDLEGGLMPSDRIMLTKRPAPWYILQCCQPSVQMRNNRAENDLRLIKNEIGEMLKHVNYLLELLEPKA